MDDFLGAGRSLLLRSWKLQQRAAQRTIDAGRTLIDAASSPTQLSGWASGLGKVLEAATDNWWDVYAFYGSIWRKAAVSGVPVLLFIIDQVAEATDSQTVSIPWDVERAKVVSSPLSDVNGKTAVGHIAADVDEVTSTLRVSAVNLANFPAKVGRWTASIYEDRLPPPRTPLANVIVSFIEPKRAKAV